MGEIIIAMMHNPPATLEPVPGTDQLCINKFNTVNHFCIVTIIGQIEPGGSFNTRTTRFIKCTERVLSSSQGQIILANVGVCREMMCDIAKRSVNHSLSARCHICKSGYTGHSA